MGDVIQLRPVEQPVTYRELATLRNVSVRWLKYRRQDGMPDAGLNWKGERVFYCSAVNPWLEEWARSKGRVLSPPSESAHQGET